MTKFFFGRSFNFSNRAISAVELNYESDIHDGISIVELRKLKSSCLLLNSHKRGDEITTFGLHFIARLNRVVFPEVGVLGLLIFLMCFFLSWGFNEKVIEPHSSLNI